MILITILSKLKVAFVVDLTLAIDLILFAHSPQLGREVKQKSKCTRCQVFRFSGCLLKYDLNEHIPYTDDSTWSP